MTRGTQPPDWYINRYGHLMCPNCAHHAQDDEDLSPKMRPWRRALGLRPGETCVSCGMAATPEVE